MAGGFPCRKDGTATEAVNREMVLQTDPSRHFVLKYMQLLNLKVGNSVLVDAVVKFGMTHGLELNDIENQLIHASAKGWILNTDHHIHLTKSGHALLNPANDNREPPYIN
jgi:hypothetical protein